MKCCVIFYVDFVANEAKDPLSPVEEAAIAGSLPDIHPEGESTISITIVGASGDLAKKKIFPALFALYYEGCLPEVSLQSGLIYSQSRIK
jgi:hypothetical protein